jgi:hypothetical protein
MSVEGSDATAAHNSTTDPTIIDIIPDEQAVALPAPEEEDKGASTTDVATDEMPRRRPISKLRDLLRLCQ